MIKKTTFLIIISAILLPLFTLAITFQPPPQGNIDFSNQVKEKISTVFKLLIWPIIVTIVILMFIMAGFSFITSKGDPSHIETARRWLVAAVIGVVVILLGYSILKIVSNILNIPLV